MLVPAAPQPSRLSATPLPSVFFYKSDTDQMTDFKAKMHQIRFRLGLRPRPRWGSLQRSPRSPSWIWGPLRGRGRSSGGEEEGKGNGKGREGEREGPQVTVEPGALRALLRHWDTALTTSLQTSPRTLRTLGRQQREAGIQLFKVTIVCYANFFFSARQSRQSLTV